MVSSLVAGMMLGLSVALPFGPVSLVCVRRSIVGGYRFGFITGMGAASAQGIFATAAWAGRNAIASELMAWSGPLRWLSAGLLLWLGLRTLTRRARPGEPTVRTGTRVAYVSSLALALSNPMTVLPYVAVASGATVTGEADAVFTSWSIPGVMAGAIAWYAVLSSGATICRTGLPAGFHRHLNLVAGSMLIVFGVWIALG